MQRALTRAKDVVHGSGTNHPNIADGTRPDRSNSATVYRPKAWILQRATGV